MKLVISIALAICCTFYAQVIHAQSNKFYVELSAGPSFPVGKFGSKDHMDSSAGFAKMGGAANILFGYQFTDKVSVLFTLGGSMHAQDAKALESRTEQNMSASITANIDADRWKAVKLMLGARWGTAISAPGKLSFYTDLSAGICKTAIPEYSGTLYFNNMLSGTFSYEKISLPWSFCYQLGAGMKYGLNGKMYLLAHLNYFDSAPTHRDKKNINFPNPAGPYVPFETKYHLSAINVLVGAGMHF